ncbi:riboflavin biosynthesis protein RibF [Stanieria cyanosphaera PCC 7437]|uniref:Riboflavin biosynthesis protein n=1 Tax=Stanieria cyanosphaera (strain ATCC 29371 / PCC 7437) TaxID=111780 RepID=K9XXQ2_STAC7|nr:bifunctional riboflavin kinase/FAD synthetase [Stanieria cyanosphaera]AFZ36442.1 riboflavin biosynthesis protein RibF [Stanieria cyanosphaera PCC 7437]
MRIADSLEQILTPTAIALGNFDGIHRGHQKVLQPVLQLSHHAGSYNYPTVVSFSPHPREFFTGKKLTLLTPVAEKAQLLEQLGIKQLVLIPFNQQLASLSPQQFVAEIIVKQLKAIAISVGEDFCFGYRRQGTAKDLVAIASEYGIEVQINSLQQCDYQQHHHHGVRISSSLIRQALQIGDIAHANYMLGRAYSLTGTVVQGQQIGRTIGFPTANLDLPPNKFLPRYGVYAVNVSYKQSQIRGVMNIGCRPTVDGMNPTIEVHLLDWSEDLYGQTLTVSLEKFLRPEQKFPSLDALKKQITADCQAART